MSSISDSRQSAITTQTGTVFYQAVYADRLDMLSGSNKARLRLCAVPQVILIVPSPLTVYRQQESSGEVQLLDQTVPQAA